MLRDVETGSLDGSLQFVLRAQSAEVLVRLPLKDVRKETVHYVRERCVISEEVSSPPVLDEFLSRGDHTAPVHEDVVAGEGDLIASRVESGCDGLLEVT